MNRFEYCLQVNTSEHIKRALNAVKQSDTFNREFTAKQPPIFLEAAYLNFEKVVFDKLEDHLRRLATAQNRDYETDQSIDTLLSVKDGIQYLYNKIVQFYPNLF